MEIGRRQGAAACSTGTPLDIIVRVVLPIMAVYYKQRRTSEIFETSTVLQIAVKFFERESCLSKSRNLFSGWHDI